MKILLLILIMVSCGKQNNLKPMNYTSLSRYADQDGDGISDEEEVTQGRNHLVADINTNNSIKDDTFILVDNFSKEYEVKIKPQRLIRTELLRSVIGLHSGIISDVNILMVDFNSSQNFWTIFHKDVHLTKYSFRIDKNQHYSLPIDFDETRSLKVNTFTDYGILDGVKEATYRLIISTPQKEIIYYLHPSISLIHFLETHHAAILSQGALIKLDGLESGYQEHEKNWDFVTDSFSSIHNPKAGKTYAFVYSDISEYTKVALLNGKKSWDTKFEIPFSHQIEKTIFVPSFHKRQMATVKNRHLIEIGEHSVYCSIKENKDQGFIPFTASAEQVKDWLDQSLLEDISVLWSHSSPKGISLRFRGTVIKQRNTALLNDKVSLAAIGIGVTESDCRFSRPNVASYPLYTGHKEYYLAD